MQFGDINEKNFAKILDHKKVDQIPKNLRDVIYAIFLNVNSDDRIDCWQSEYYEKSDIKIKINGEIKGISIKTGTYCSMHQESIDSLYPFFRRIGVEESVIQMFDDFLLGYINGERVDSKTYISSHIKEINQIKERFNNYYIKTNLILRFIFQGTEKQKYDCDIIIYGTPKNFIWAKKDEILEYLINYNKTKENVINFGALNIKCYDRNLRNNQNRKSKQREIQVKWSTLEKDFVEIINNRKYQQNNKFIIK